MLGGNFRKFGTESNGISGTFCALALLCANTGLNERSPTMTPLAMMNRFMKASEGVDSAIYTTGLHRFKRR